MSTITYVTDQSLQEIPIIYGTGNQRISGTKTFASGIFAPNLIYITGAQTISGAKTFRYDQNQSFIVNNKNNNSSQGYININEYNAKWGYGYNSVVSNYFGNTVNGFLFLNNDLYSNSDLYGNYLYINGIFDQEDASSILEMHSGSIILKPSNVLGTGYVNIGDLPYGPFVELRVQGNAYARNLVYNTGTQTISGTKNFATRPTVNGTGVLLSGEASAGTFTNVIYTTGNQTISGIKTFASRPIVSGSGLLLTGEALPAKFIDFLTPTTITQSNNAVTQTIDIISSGVRLTRGDCCLLYNPLFDTPGQNPTNTEWNADGWSDLSNLSSRTYFTLLYVTPNGENFGNWIIGKNLIMRDTTTNKYYKFIFNSWQAGAGSSPNYRGFSYTRTEIGSYYEVSTSTNFTSRPTVNGTGVLLNGEASAVTLPTTIVYTTGNQTVSGIKTFASRPTVNGISVLLSGEAASLPTTILYTTGNQIKSGRLIIGDDAGSIVDPNSPYTLSLQTNSPATWLEILNNSGSNKGVFFGIQDNDFEQYNWQGGDIKFFTSQNPSDGTERLRITKSGNVGIGTNSPSEKLEVAGNIKVTNSGFFTSGIKVGNSSIIITENRIDGGYNASNGNLIDGLLGIQYSGYFDNDSEWFKTATIEPIINELVVTGVSASGTYIRVSNILNQGTSYFQGPNSWAIRYYSQAPLGESYWYLSPNYSTGYFTSLDLKTWSLAQNIPAWNGGGTYNINDIVSHGGSNWICKAYAPVGYGPFGGYLDGTANGTDYWDELPATQNSTVTQTQNSENSTVFNADRALLNGTSWEWVGYFVPQVTETYNFYLGNIDEAGYFWMGDKALNGYTTGNADLINNSNVQNLLLNSGQSYPVRLQWGHPITPTNLGIQLGYQIPNLSFYSYDWSGVFFHGSVGKGFYIETISGDASFAGNVQANSATFNTRPTVNGTGIVLNGEVSTILSGVFYTAEVNIKNNNGSTIYKGQPVYVSSAQGSNILVKLASNTGESTSSKTFGLVNQSSLAQNAQGTVVTEGLLQGFNTSEAGNEGDPIWLGTTGNLIYGLTNKPQAPNHLVYLGVVTRKHATQGEIFVHIQNGFEVRELHDARIINEQNKDVLIYNSGSGLWLNRQITTGDVYGISNYATVSNLATTGSTLDTKINSLSGTLTGGYATITNLATTGSTLDTKINSLSGYVTGVTGTFGASVNALNTYAVLTTGNQTISGIKTFTTGIDIVNGINAQSLRVFNATGTNSGEFGGFGCQATGTGSAPNALVIGAQASQSGALRDVIITGNNLQLSTTSGKAGVYINRSSIANSTLFEVQANGVNKININQEVGVADQAPVISIAGPGYQSSIRTRTSNGVGLNFNSIFGIGAQLEFLSSANSNSNGDVVLVRDGAGILAQRNGLSPQQFRVYNYTGTNSGEFGKIGWSNNALQIGTEKGGSGVARGIEFQTDGVNRFSISSNGGIQSQAGLQCNGGSVSIPNAYNFYWASRSSLGSSADGIIRITNNAETDFNRLQFGGTTSSFPAIKRSSQNLQFRLADDSNFTNVEANKFIAYSGTDIYFSGTAGTGASGSSVGVLVSGLWNNTGQTYTGVRYNVTLDSSASGLVPNTTNSLLNLAVNNTGVFNVNSKGQILIQQLAGATVYDNVFEVKKGSTSLLKIRDDGATEIGLGGTANQACYFGGTISAGIKNGGIVTANGGFLGFSSTSDPMNSLTDHTVRLYRGADFVLDLRNATYPTSSHQFRVFNATGTNSGEFGVFGWQAMGTGSAPNALVIGAQATQSGILRDVILTGANIRLNPVSGSIIATNGIINNSTAILDLSQTWSGASVFTGFNLNIIRGSNATNTSANTRLMNVQMDGYTHFAVRPAFDVDTTNASDWQHAGQSVRITNNNGTVGFTVRGSQNIVGIPTASAFAWGTSIANLSYDLALYRDAAGILAQRNGLNAQQFRVYNYTGTNSGEFGVFGWQVTGSGQSNALVIGAQASQSGILRDVILTGNNIYINTAGGTIFNASAAASLLADFQVGGVSKFNIDKNGGAMLGANAFGVNGGAGNVGLWNLGLFGWSASSSVGSTITLDTALARDSAGILAQRNGLNAQQFRVYNYTATNSGEFGKIGWSNNVLQIGTEKGGSGVARGIEFQTDGVNRFSISSNGGIQSQQGLQCNAGSVIIPNAYNFFWSSRSSLGSSADGIIRITNNAETDFDRLQFGGTTNVFPAIKRSGTDLQIRLADNSAYSTMDAQHRLQGTAPTTPTGSGTAGDMRYDNDYIYICTATNTWKRTAITGGW